jgi:hypothetical protein
VNYIEAEALLTLMMFGTGCLQLQTRWSVLVVFPLCTLPVKRHHYSQTVVIRAELWACFATSHDLFFRDISFSRLALTNFCSEFPASLAYSQIERERSRGPFCNRKCNVSKNLVTPQIKKFWEELMAYVLSVRHGPHRKRRFQQFIHCCMCIRIRGNVFTEPFACNDRGIHV